MIYKKLGTGITFSAGKPVLQVFARNEENRKVSLPLKHLPIYFYVKAGTKFDTDEDNAKVVNRLPGYMSIYGEALDKIFVKKISDMRYLSREYGGYEGDIKWDKKMCLDLKLTDRFYYENNKLYSLDKRFLGGIDNIRDSGGISSVVNVSSAVDSDQLRGLSDLSDTIQFGANVACLDIEVIVDNKEDLRNYKGVIVCVVVYDVSAKEYKVFRISEDIKEKTMIRQVWDYLKNKNFDIITGWNIDFDIGWLVDRARQLDVEISNNYGVIKDFSYRGKDGKFRHEIVIPGVSIMDGKELYIKQTATSEKLASYSLKAVAVAEGFPEWEDLGTNMKVNWRDQAEKVVEYCKIDVQRTWEVIDKKGLIRQANTLCSITGANLDESMWNSKVIDSMLFLYKGNMILPNIKYGNKETNIEGARVMKAIKGKHENVAVLDAASLYPSIITGFNISSETLVQEKDRYKYLKDQMYWIKVKVNDEDRIYTFLKKDIKLGLLPKVVLELRKLREQIRNDRRKATEMGDKDGFKQLNDQEKVIKGLLASVYGVTGFSSFRLFNEDCANAITGVARGVILETIDKLQSERFNVIYGDTDSVFVKMDNHEEGYVARDKINEIMLNYVKSFGVDESVIQMNYEKFFKWIMFSQEPSVKLKSKIRRKEGKATKKKYIGFISHVEGKDGLMAETNELYYKGFELRRSDASPVLKRVMKEFFVRMANGDYNASVGYLKSVKKNFSDYDMNDVAMPRSVNNEDAEGPYPRGMRYAKEVLEFEFNEDELPKLIYVKPQYKYPKTEEICYQSHHEIPEVFKIDYDKMFDKLIKKKFEPILEALGMYWDTSVNDQQTLEVFC